MPGALSYHPSIVIALTAPPLVLISWQSGLHHFDIITSDLSTYVERVAIRELGFQGAASDGALCRPCLS